MNASKRSASTPTAGRVTSAPQPLTASALPRRLATPIIGLANATGCSVETAAALTALHLATWCGERSGVYALDERWVPAACNQLHCFPDPAVMARAQSVLTDEFDRLETQLRPLITSTWVEKQEDERRLAASLEIGRAHV